MINIYLTKWVNMHTDQDMHAHTKNVHLRVCAQTHTQTHRHTHTPTCIHRYIPKHTIVIHFLLKCVNHISSDISEDGLQARCICVRSCVCASLCVCVYVRACQCTCPSKQRMRRVTVQRGYGT